MSRTASIHAVDVTRCSTWRMHSAPASSLPSGRSMQRSVEAFLDWCIEYEEIHQWEPDWIAIGWKGGVGTLKTYLHRKIKKGVIRGKTHRVPQRKMEDGQVLTLV